MNPIKDRVVTDLEQVKTQGGKRISRIRDIVRAAASQAIAEVKAGSGEIRDITSGTLSNVVENFSNSPADASPDESSPTLRLKQRVASLVVALKTPLSGPFKRRVATLNEAATQRYGTSYTAVKQRLSDTASQYRQAIATAETQGIDLLQSKQIQIESKAGAVGSAVARQEQKIKQQLKSMLKTTVNRP